MKKRGCNLLIYAPTPKAVWRSHRWTPLSAAYMRQWIRSALVQVMAYRLFAAPIHYRNQCWVIVNWTLRSKLQWSFNQNTKLFIHENTSEMAAILSRGRWMNEWILTHLKKIMDIITCPCPNLFFFTNGSLWLAVGICNHHVGLQGWVSDRFISQVLLWNAPDSTTCTRHSVGKDGDISAPCNALWADHCAPGDMIYKRRIMSLLTRTVVLVCFWFHHNALLLWRYEPVA